MSTTPSTNLEGAVKIGSLGFSGFSEPKDHWYRLPNNWFDIWHAVRNQYDPRFAPMLKMTEYILKHTWGVGRFNGQVQLSADEIRSGRRRTKSTRFDHGTGISPSSVQNASKVLAEFGLLEVEQDQKDLARRLRTYRPHIHEEHTSEPLSGFSLPTQNFFKVPNIWSDITANISSAATILTVEYLFRHTWGFNNKDGVWLSADEIAAGRLYSDGRRYDDGTGFEISSIHRALKEAVALGLIVWTEKYEAGINKRLFNLHIKGMRINENGEYLGFAAEEPAQSCESNEMVCDGIDGNPICEIGNPERADASVLGNNKEVHSTNVARSGREYTLKDTFSKHELKTPSSRGAKKTKRKRHRAKKAGDGDLPNLPDDLIEILTEIGWNDSLRSIQKVYQNDPALVRAWAEHTQEKTGLTNKAGYFRKRLFSGEKPPITKNVDREDRNRYLNSKYAEYFD